MTKKQSMYMPGPWELEHIPSSLNDDGSQTVEHWNVIADGFEIFSTGFLPVAREEKQATASLITAAPELFEACEASHNATTQAELDRAVKLIEAAIKKAKGVL